MSALKQLAPSRRGRPAKADRPTPLKGVHRATLVYARLREAIRTGTLATGERVREVEIAHWLGVSRTPVRDALRRLESEGLLRHAARRGLIVTELDAQEVLELYALREALEGMAAALCARYASETELRSLHEIIGLQRAARNDIAKQAELNRQFHEVLYQASRNRYLLQALASLRDALALLKDTTYSVPGRPASALSEHLRIYEAIKRQDASGAELAARKHIRQASNSRLAMILGPRGTPLRVESRSPSRA